MQQTSGSSCCRCGDESALDVVAAVVVSFLLMVRGNSFQSIRWLHSGSVVFYEEEGTRS
jgi:hypothetical protein